MSLSTYKDTFKVYHGTVHTHAIWIVIKENYIWYMLMIGTNIIGTNHKVVLFAINQFGFTISCNLKTKRTRGYTLCTSKAVLIRTILQSSTEAALLFRGDTGTENKYGSYK